LPASVVSWPFAAPNNVRSDKLLIWISSV